MCEKNSDNCIFIMLLCPQLYVAVIPYIKATKVPFSSTKKKTLKKLHWFSGWDFWVFCPLKDVLERQSPHQAMQKRLHSVPLGFDAQSRERRSALHQHLPLEVLNFPWYVQKALRNNYPHTHKLVRIGWVILIRFSPSESCAILKDHQTLVLMDITQWSTQLNMYRWLFVFEGWRHQINNNFYRYLEENFNSHKTHYE